MILLLLLLLLILFFSGEKTIESLFNPKKELAKYLFPLKLKVCTSLSESLILEFEKA